MEYRIQPGDTITNVTKRLGTDWNTLKRANPGAIGKSTKTGEWIVKAGKTVSVPPSFQEILAQQTAKQSAQKPVNNPSPSSPQPAPQAQATAFQVQTIEVVLEGISVWSRAHEQSKVEGAATLGSNRKNQPNPLQNGRQPRNSIKKKGDGATQEVVASWYGKIHQGRTMANGARFDMYRATIAHRDIPLGTKVELENPKTGEKAKATVTDRGPLIPGRDVDLSYGLAKRLSLVRQGVGNLKMRLL